MHGFLEAFNSERWFDICQDRWALRPKLEWLKESLEATTALDFPSEVGVLLLNLKSEPHVSWPPDSPSDPSMDSQHAKARYEVFRFPGLFFLFCACHGCGHVRQ